MSTIFRQRIESGVVVFNVGAEAPPGAANWGLDVMEGWKSTGEPTLLSTELGNMNDGVALNDVFPIRQRFITVGGYVYAATEAQAEELADILVRDAFPRNSTVKLTRFEATPRYAMVRRSGAFDTDWSAVQTGFRWQTTLVAADPLLYGTETLSASAGVSGQSDTGLTFPVVFPVIFPSVAGEANDAASVVNRGTAYSPSVRATLLGPLPQGSWRLRNDTTDQEITYDLGLAASDELVIDMARQTATLNGFPLSTPPEGEFLTLAPGSNDIRLYSEFDPDAGVTINAESAWE